MAKVYYTQMYQRQTEVEVTDEQLAEIKTPTNDDRYGDIRQAIVDKALGLIEGEPYEFIQAEVSDEDGGGLFDVEA